MSDGIYDKKEHAAQLRVVLDAVLATGIEPGALPPLMAGVAGMLLGEHVVVEKGAGIRELDLGLGLVSMAMRVSARMAARHGGREGAMAEITKSAHRHG